jgi:hypothetical protein
MHACVLAEGRQALGQSAVADRLGWLHRFSRPRRVRAA